MTVHSVSYLFVEFGEVVGFSEDGFAESACCVAAFRGFFYEEDKIVHNIYAYYECRKRRVFARN